MTIMMKSVLLAVCVTIAVSHDIQTSHTSCDQVTCEEHQVCHVYDVYDRTCLCPNGEPQRAVGEMYQDAAGEMNFNINHCPETCPDVKRAVCDPKHRPCATHKDSCTKEGEYCVETLNETQNCTNNLIDPHAMVIPDRSAWTCEEVVTGTCQKHECHSCQSFPGTECVINYYNVACKEDFTPFYQSYEYCVRPIATCSMKPSLTIIPTTGPRIGEETPEVEPSQDVSEPSTLCLANCFQNQERRTQQFDNVDTPLECVRYRGEDGEIDETCVEIPGLVRMEIGKLITEFTRFNKTG